MRGSLDEAAREASTCTWCPLAQSRTQVVYGVGHPDADLMFIGEAPGEQEDQQGEPFVGDAGQLLNKMLCEIRIRREDVYIANVSKCRPQKNQKNRHPEGCVNSDFRRSRAESGFWHPSRYRHLIATRSSSGVHTESLPMGRRPSGRSTERSSHRNRAQSASHPVSRQGCYGRGCSLVAQARPADE